MTTKERTPPLLALTPGEPAGIGPEIALRLAQHRWPARLVAIADPQLMQDTASRLALPVEVQTLDLSDIGLTPAHREGVLTVAGVPLVTAAVPGELNTANAPYVLATLEFAAKACLAGRLDAMITGPVHKGVINDSGYAFSGHTELLARIAGVDSTVMMLATQSLRVALVTTHIPLADVAAAITADRLAHTCRVVDKALRTQFAISKPRLMVLGLNPHAGESGHLGREELDIIAPTLAQLQESGMAIIGPVPADTAFTADWLARCDVVVAMYHDQGLPVLKAQGFGEAVNVTLGLPFIRTSVDHGTALDIAAKGIADGGSLAAATSLALKLAQRRRANG